MLKVYVGVNESKMGFVITDKGKEFYRYVENKYSNLSDMDSLLEMISDAVKKLNYLYDIKKVDRMYDKVYVVVSNAKLIDYISGVRKAKGDTLTKGLVQLGFNLAVSRFSLEFLSDENIVKIKVFGQEDGDKSSSEYENVLDILGN